MRGNLYGWKYWLGAVVVVLALIAIWLALALFTGTVATWRSEVSLILGLVMWPFLILYHVVWEWRMRRNLGSK